MPPTTLSIDPPAYEDYGEGARLWLEHHGYVATTPTIRSRDLDNCRRDPFFYYLTRRLSLTPILSTPSSTLARGSWMHKFMEGVRLEPGSAHDLFSRALDVRLEELRDLCEIVGWGSDKLLNALDRERLDAECARGWIIALSSLPLPQLGLPRGIIDWVRSPAITPIAYEATVRYTDPNYPKTPLAGTFDLLYHVPATNTVWVIDYKNTSDSPSIWAETAIRSFQTTHYRYLLSKLIATGELNAAFPQIPPGAKFGGIVHILLQKPSIVFGQKDRPYHYLSEGKKSGISGTAAPLPGTAWQVTTEGPQHPRITANYPTEDEAVKRLHEITGKTPSSVYSGEPDPHFYAARCLHWYRGTGEYADKYDERQVEPPVNISTITGPLDSHELRWYYQHLDYIYDHATRIPEPIRFPPTSNGMRRGKGGDLNPWAPLFTAPVADWPSIILRNSLTQSHIDHEPA